MIFYKHHNRCRNQPERESLMPVGLDWTTIMHSTKDPTEMQCCNTSPLHCTGHVRDECAQIQPTIGEPLLLCSNTRVLEPHTHTGPVTCVMNPIPDDCYVPCSTRLGHFHSLVQQNGRSGADSDRTTYIPITCQPQPCGTGEAMATGNR